MKLNGCCCCFDLKTGVAVIGILALIGQLSTIAMPFSHNDLACNTFYIKECSDLNNGEITLITIYNLANIVFIIMMIYGSQKNRPSIMLPMLISSIIGMFVIFVMMWIISVMVFTHSEIGSGVVMLLVGHVILSLMFYFFMVIYSRYKDLKYDQLPAYPKENFPLYS